MEIQLQELIERIKTDGVAVAEKEASSKLSAANEEADKIIADAKTQAAQIIRQAREENDRMVKAGEDAIRQAGRNLLISFRESVTKELDAIIGAQVAQAYSPEALATLIPTVVENWAQKNGEADLSILLSPQDLAALEESLLAALQQRFKGGVTLKPDERINGGFRIAAENGGAYYDFSADTVAEMFAAYLNPRVAALLKEAGSL